MEEKMEREKRDESKGDTGVRGEEEEDRTIFIYRRKRRATLLTRILIITIIKKGYVKDHRAPEAGARGHDHVNCTLQTENC